MVMHIVTVEKQHTKFPEKINYKSRDEFSSTKTCLLANIRSKISQMV